MLMNRNKNLIFKSHNATAFMFLSCEQNTLSAARNMISEQLTIGLDWSIMAGKMTHDDT